MRTRGCLVLAGAIALTLAAGFASPASASWPTDSLVNVPICTAPGYQLFPSMVADGTGGAIVVWQDERNGVDSDVYAQHVLASGTVDPGWPIDGLVVSAARDNQYFAVTVPDGSGGAIVAWQDDRDETHSHVFAQRILASGSVDPAWPVDGVAVCPVAGDQLMPAIAPDGAGGAIVAWVSYSAAGAYDIFAGHVLATGTLDSLWPVSGSPVCTAPGEQALATIAQDGADGAIISWQDYRGDSLQYFSQHILAGGGGDPTWPMDGLLLASDPHGQRVPSVTPDNAGGVIVTWENTNSEGGYDILAQHVLDSGAPDPRWPSEGRSVCARGTTYAPTIVAGVNGGAIIAWQDARNGGYDIYAQRIQANGQLGGDDVVVEALAEFMEANAIPEGMRLSWRLASRGRGEATIYRSIVGDAWRDLARVSANDAGVITYEDGSAEPGVRYGYRLGMLSLGTVTFAGEAWVDVPTSQRFWLGPPSPNPSRERIAMPFALPASAPATIRVVDIAGRIVLSREVGSLGVGRHVLSIVTRGKVPSGIYVVTLEQGTQSTHVRLAVVR